MTNQYFIFEFIHCNHTWQGLSEHSRCRSCRKMIHSPYKRLVSNRVESKAEFLQKFKGVLK